MVVTLVLITFSFISNSALTSTVKNVTDKIDVSVFLAPSVTDQQRQDFMNQLQANENVASVSYVSRDQAVANYREQNKDNPQLLQALDLAGNVLPASIQIKSKD